MSREDLAALVMAEVAGPEQKERQRYHLLISEFGQRIKSQQF
jgi:hypothetical protein